MAQAGLKLAKKLRLKARPALRENSTETEREGRVRPSFLALGSSNRKQDYQNDLAKPSRDNCVANGDVH